jgi:hypothetical protein
MTLSHNTSMEQLTVLSLPRCLPPSMPASLPPSLGVGHIIRDTHDTLGAPDYPKIDYKAVMPAYLNMQNKLAMEIEKMVSEYKKIVTNRYIETFHVVQYYFLYLFFILCFSFFIFIFYFSFVSVNVMVCCWRFFNTPHLYRTSLSYRPCFHLWFLEKFQDPADWLEARTTFTRSTAVWSAVGYIVGRPVCDLEF